MVELKKKQLLSLAAELSAVDITTVDPRDIAFPKSWQKIAYSTGDGGANGVIVRDRYGVFYYTRSRCSNTLYLL